MTYFIQTIKKVIECRKMMQKLIQKSDIKKSRFHPYLEPL